jgi:6-phosphofructokinase 1
MANEQKDTGFAIRQLGFAVVPSPKAQSGHGGHGGAVWVDDSRRLIYDPETGLDAASLDPDGHQLLELAGPRQQIYFDPSSVHAAVVTCGGLCPGLNDVIRAIVMGLWYGYGVRRISGIRYGYRGFLPEFGLTPLELNPDVVSDIHKEGGTILGSSRGYGDRVDQILDTIRQRGINVLFTIGGDGTQKGALRIAQGIHRQGLSIAVVGVPKTIDNDLSYVQRSFGFETAVEMAVQAVAGAHTEARGALTAWASSR